MKRGLVVALIVVVLLMGLGVVMPSPAHDASAAVHGCTVCFAVLIVIGSSFVVAVRNVAARSEVFAALCHPSPLERPPRLAG